MNILLTGGAGYIGSHAAITLSQAGHEVVLLDNFSNSNPFVLKQLEKILGKSIPFIEADVRNSEAVEAALLSYEIDAVFHFAGLKAVGESVANPLLYYSNNVGGSISLLNAMRAADVKKFIFSSSATVYGEPIYLPYDEDHPTKPINPYGRSKLQVEKILQDLAMADPEWGIVSLRYFNPVGAHESGLIGEEANQIPNNLMPYLVKVASGELPHLNILGNDYKTRDGTGERDYIHVMDLVEGHMAALKFLDEGRGINFINLGTGNPTSVMELITEFMSVSGKKIKTVIQPRRPGDLPIYYANPGRAKQQLGWRSKRTLSDICKSIWNYQVKKNSATNI